MNVASARDATQGSLCFLKTFDLDSVNEILAARASVILTPPIRDSYEINYGKTTLIVSENPRLAFCLIYQALRMAGMKLTLDRNYETSISKHATVSSRAYIEDGVSIGAGSYISPGVVLLSGTRLGKNVSIGPNTVIGYEGFGYERIPAGGVIEFPHVGGVVIEDNVKIGANTCIDRGSLGDTIIRTGARIDNLVHVAHNVVIGEETFVIATAILCGSVTIGPRAWVAPNASVREGLVIGKDAVIGLGAVVTKDVEDGETVIGNPARTRNKDK